MLYCRALRRSSVVTASAIPASCCWTFAPFPFSPFCSFSSLASVRGVRRFPFSFDCPIHGAVPWTVGFSFSFPFSFGALSGHMSGLSAVVADSALAFAFTHGHHCAVFHCTAPILLRCFPLPVFIFIPELVKFFFLLAGRHIHLVGWLALCSNRICVLQHAVFEVMERDAATNIDSTMPVGFSVHEPQDNAFTMHVVWSLTDNFCYSSDFVLQV